MDIAGFIAFQRLKSGKPVFLFSFGCAEFGNVAGINKKNAMDD